MPNPLPVLCLIFHNISVGSNYSMGPIKGETNLANIYIKDVNDIHVKILLKLFLYFLDSLIVISKKWSRSTSDEIIGCRYSCDIYMIITSLLMSYHHIWCNSWEVLNSDIISSVNGEMPSCLIHLISIPYLLSWLNPFVTQYSQKLAWLIRPQR